MSHLDELLTDQFYRWEMRGRGWQIFDAPVTLEPRFRPFYGHFLPRSSPTDDGRKHTRLSSFVERLRLSAAPPEPAPETAESEDEPAQYWRETDELSELQLTLPVARSIPTPQVETFIRHVCRGGEPLTFEILGTEREIVPQFVASPRASTRIERALGANFAGMVVTPGSDALIGAFGESASSFAVVDFGLGLEFMLPLGDPRTGLLAGVVSALDALAESELGLCQILFEPTQNPWSQSIRAAVSDQEGQPFFVNRPELVSAAEQKIASPLFAVVIRLAACAEELSRSWEIVADMASGFSALSRSGSNYLVPLHNDEYPTSAHERDLLDRQSRRSGMLLNLEELAHFLTLPTAAVSCRLRRDTAKTRPAPEFATRGGALLLGDNRHTRVVQEVRLSPEHRVRHTHIIGASGTGKSTLLFNLICQDMESGQGVAVLDPHGDLIDRVLGIIPPERIADVVLIDPSDEEHSVGFNILAAHSDFEKSLLASDLVSVFQRLSTSWGDQMNSVLRNAILAFLESSEGGTLADLRRFLLDAGFRNRFLATVTDPEIVYYWRKAFPQLTGNKSIGPVVTRLDEFLSRKPIRHMVSQKENRVNFADVLDGGRILLAKLPQGLIGRENSYLLGSLLLSKLQQMAMSRQRMRESERRDFWCYVDEFHCFITPSMAEILTGARKYRVGLTLAHQELRQLQANDEVAGAVLANAFTRVVFRVGDADARSLENGFSHFEARDLQNLEIGDAICRIERSDFDFNLSVRLPEPPAADDDARRKEVIVASRAKYARTRSEIEEELMRKWQTEEAQDAPKTKAASPPIESASPLAPLPQPVVLPPASPPVETPADTQIPKASEKKTSPAIQAKSIVEPAGPRELPDLGRGGAQHQAIQQRIKATADEAGFRVTVEKSVLDAQGSIDLALEKPGISIACEINVTSTIDYEVGNVSKCLKAGFAHIAVICPRPDRLSRLEEAMRGCFPPEETARIFFYLPEEFVLYLQRTWDEGSPPKVTGAPAEKRRRGYKVRRSFVEVSPEEAKLREESALKMIAEKLRRLPKE
jgi:hypothetical protein